LVEGRLLPIKMKWTVHKFGGTSVANADRYEGVARILADQQTPGTHTAVIVSAMSGVTDSLLDLVNRAPARDDSYSEKLEELKQKHLDTIHAALADDSQKQALADIIEADFRDLAEVLKGVSISRIASEEVKEFVSGHGELWSAQLLHRTLLRSGLSSAWLDAREVLVVEPSTNQVTIDWDLSQQRLNQWLSDHSPIAETVVITGYIASTREGIATTLKRNGSDFSASIFGALLAAESITIWTDVDGVMTADPNRVPDALVIPDLSYQEASELAYFGAKVIHPSTMYPAIAREIPIRIKNTFNPAAAGTGIFISSGTTSPIKGFATVDEMTLINIEGTGMTGVPGVAQKLFGALSAVNVSVVMISQASSEHSICLAIPTRQASLAKQTIEVTFEAEIRRGAVQTIELVDDCCILAMVGDGMIEHLGIAGRFFNALGRAGVNVRAIAQGSSERNISAVITQRDSTKALRAVHSAFYLSPQTISVGVIGTGLIGGTFLNQLAARLHTLRTERGVDLRVRGVMNSRHMLLHDRHLDLGRWKEDLNACNTPADIARFVEHIHVGHLPHAVIVDATASDDLPRRYDSWLRSGVNIVTPNKKGNAGPLEQFRKLRDALRESGQYFLYETNVGAGLPIIHTLRNLLDTGDTVIRIEGVLSGTLSYIFNSLDGTRPFSAILRAAHQQGFTEPDPRDDLSGMDMARKLIILAREIGLEVELNQVEVESLVPEGLQSGSPEDFLNDLEKYDQSIAALLENARNRGEVLRYVGTIDADGTVSAGLRTFPGNHPFANLKGSDNIVSFQTARYNTQPMIVSGPGAGPEVTAAGVFSDLLRLASFLGARQ
jgi:bifunctional aspartokinase / homoserine dehydrogenase 1